MPVAFEGPPDERSGLAMFLDEQRAALLRKLEGLNQEQAVSRPTVSEFCMLTLVKHVACVERRWFQLEVALRDIPGLWPPPDRRELELEAGDTVESIRAMYEGVIAENRAILEAVTDLDSLSDTNVNRRWFCCISSRRSPVTRARPTSSVRASTAPRVAERRNHGKDDHASR